MGAAFLITLREGLEAALIVAIVLAYLRQLGRADQFRWVALGALAGALVALGAGTGIYLAIGELEGRAEQFTEATIGLTAVAVLTWMVFWMRRQSRTIGGALSMQLPMPTRAQRDRMTRRARLTTRAERDPRDLGRRMTRRARLRTWAQSDPRR